MPTPWEKEEFHDSLEWERKARSGSLISIPCIGAWIDVCGFGSQSVSYTHLDVYKRQSRNRFVIPDKRRSRADPGSIVEFRSPPMDPGASQG